MKNFLLSYNTNKILFIIKSTPNRAIKRCIRLFSITTVRANPSNYLRNAKIHLERQLKAKIDFDRSSYRVDITKDAVKKYEEFVATTELDKKRQITEIQDTMSTIKARYYADLEINKIKGLADDSPATLKIKDTFEAERKALERVATKHDLAEGTDFSDNIDSNTNSAIKLITKEDAVKYGLKKKTPSEIEEETDAYLALQAQAEPLDILDQD